jgi:hypothetical protein
VNTTVRCLHLTDLRAFTSMRKHPWIMYLILGVLYMVTLFGIARISYAQKIDRKRPGIYIAFKEFIAKTPDPAYPSQGARLVLHNNTRWPIYFGTHYDPTVDGQQISYVIELENGCYDPRLYSDVVFKGKLMPGKTLNLVVPRADFPNGSMIYVEFTFSWEVYKGHNETVHRAYFYSSDLPDWPK